MRTALVCTGVVALVLAACADDGRNIRSFRPACSSTATGDTSVAVRLHDDRVTLAPGATTAGRVAFVVRNAGSRAHSFHVARVTPTTPSVVGSIASIARGDVCALALSLPAGSYVVYCDDDDHVDEGMRTKLRIS